jgi:hypothetical protein
MDITYEPYIITRTLSLPNVFFACWFLLSMSYLLLERLVEDSQGQRAQHQMPAPSAI